MNILFDIKLLDSLVKTQLFTDIDPEPAQAMLACFNSEIISYKSNETIINQGDEISKIGIVLSGYVYICKLDVNGNRNIIDCLNEGEIFNEVFSSAGLDSSSASVISGTDTTVIFIEYHRIVRNCVHICESHTKLIQNILSMMSRRTIRLTEKLEIIGKRSIREKLKAYIVHLMENNTRDTHVVAFDLSRQELADFLCVDRSALSREISNMSKEGLISVDNRKISIKNIELFWLIDLVQQYYDIYNIEQVICQYELQALVRELECGHEISWDWFILLLSKTGLRFAKALALTPADFDFQNQTITVSKSWDYISPNRGFHDTKNI